jgi:hypothetical protein
MIEQDFLLLVGACLPLAHRVISWQSPLGRFRREADINWQAKPAGWVENDPERS